MAKEFFKGFIHPGSTLPRHTASFIGSTTGIAAAWNSQNDTTSSANLIKFFEGLGELGSNSTKYTKIKLRISSPEPSPMTDVLNSRIGDAEIIIVWGSHVIVQATRCLSPLDGSVFEQGVNHEYYKKFDLSSASGRTSLVVNTFLRTPGPESAIPTWNDTGTATLIINVDTLKIVGLPVFYAGYDSEGAGTSWGAGVHSWSIENDDGRSVSGGGMPGEVTGTKISKLENAAEAQGTDKFVLSRDYPVGGDYEASYNIKYSALYTTIEGGSGGPGWGSSTYKTELAASTPFKEALATQGTDTLFGPILTLSKPTLGDGKEGAQIVMNAAGSQGGESSKTWSLDVYTDIDDAYGFGSDRQLFRIFHNTTENAKHSINMDDLGRVQMPNLPTSNPGNGILWTDTSAGNVVKVGAP